MLGIDHAPSITRTLHFTNCSKTNFDICVKNIYIYIYIFSKPELYPNVLGFIRYIRTQPEVHSGLNFYIQTQNFSHELDQVIGYHRQA